MTAIQQYIQTNKQRFLDELFELLRIPSVSTDPKFVTHLIKAAKFLSNELRRIGLENVRLYPSEGYPVVFGEKIIDKNLPTVLVYGHYDVQPADPHELWDSPPFEPIIRNEKIYARGACDDKGQMYMHLKAFEAMINTDSLPCNVKFMIEGEEESGSKNLEEFVKSFTHKLDADIILISDTALIDNKTPCITVGLRGMAYMEIEITAANKDLHSGVYGGVAPNPINALAEIIAALKDDQNRITIPGFYDKVVELSTQQRATISQAPFDEVAYKKELQLDALQGEAGYNPIEHTGIRPCLDVNGIIGGYTGEGAKTIIPSKASAKISMRLVPNQSPEEIAQCFADYVQDLAPKGVKVKVIQHHLGEAALISTDSVGYRAANMAYKKSFGKEAIPARMGGSIPIVAMFKHVLRLDSIMMGFGLNTDNVHSPNEHFGVFNYMKGIETIPLFYQYFVDLSKK